MATHNIGEPKCPECGRKFARMASLKSHMLMHEKEENLFCTECEDAFTTKVKFNIIDQLFIIFYSSLERTSVEFTTSAIPAPCDRSLNYSYKNIQ